MFDVLKSRNFIKLAIVIPEFNQPQLAIEAIEDALAQTNCPDFAVVLSSDASLFAEIDDIARIYQVSHSNFFYIQARHNQGLAGNRNSAVKFCLQNFPALEAITFLDSDDRLHQKALGHFYQSLIGAKDEEPRVGWIYTDPYQFGGIHGYLRKPSQYKILWHMLANSNSATSLIDVSVFEEGCFFDETMKKGSEDWAFWLSAVSKGFIGKFVNPPTFGYRRRAESMSSDATFYRSEIVDYVRSKFPELYNRNKIFELQDLELPLYAAIQTDKLASVIKFSDVADMRSPIPLSDFVESLVQQRADPLSHAIKCFCVSHSTTFEVMKDMGILNWLLWYTATFSNIAGVAVVLSNGDKTEITHDKSASATVPYCHMLLVPFASLNKSSTNSLNDGIYIQMRLCLSDQNYSPLDINFISEHLYKKLSEASFDRAGESKKYLTLWRPNGAVGRDVVDNLLGTVDHLPLRKIGDRLNVGIAVGASNLKSGNIEALLNFLRFWNSLRAQFRVVLYFPLEYIDVGLDIARNTGVKDVFFIPDSLLYTARSDEKNYLGARITPWMVFADKAAAIGPFCGLDFFFNIAFAELSALAFPLRKKGIRTGAVIPTDVRSSHHRGIGSNFQMPIYGPSSFIDNILAYEHAYDFIISGSLDDIPWLAAKGLPADKILGTVEAWSFDIRRLRKTINDTTISNHIDRSVIDTYIETILGD